MTPYQKLKHEMEAWLSRHREPSNYRTYYRGHADCSWEIVPSICRNAEDKSLESVILSEQMEAGNWDVNKGLFENIAHLQHYGIHTRFLDYTTDADIAIFFACAHHADTDAEVIACQYDFRGASYSDTILITELALLREPVLVSDFVSAILKTYPELRNRANPYETPETHLGLSVLSWLDHGFMVTPSPEEYAQLKGWNPRIWNQKGAFFIPGNKSDPPFPGASTSDIRCKFHCVSTICTHF